MPAKLTTIINKISSIRNPMNSVIIREFSEYMKENGSSEHHQNNNLKPLIAIHYTQEFIGSYQRSEQVIHFEKPLDAHFILQ